ncbi:unnamed protein product [Phytophthora lilii]|uniref:Unnamed protein product n=1 Tax=Phytophthora lilii TaxID=2077276 RepID=A0A9W6TAI2_9STRA|nr:unnamed protein product [Phytophthora lilii]
MSDTINFGKYKNTPISELFDIYPSYCRCLFKQESLLEDDSPIESYLQEKFTDAGDDSYILKWGKFKGKTVKWLSKNNKKYFDWLQKSDYVSEKCPKLKEDLLKFMPAEN